jgi:hypothetical protein
VFIDVLEIICECAMHAVQQNKKCSRNTGEPKNWTVILTADYSAITAEARHLNKMAGFNRKISHMLLWLNLCIAGCFYTLLVFPNCNTYYRRVIYAPQWVEFLLVTIYQYTMSMMFIV